MTTMLLITKTMASQQIGECLLDNFVVVLVLVECTYWTFPCISFFYYYYTTTTTNNNNNNPETNVQPSPVLLVVQ